MFVVFVVNNFIRQMCQVINYALISALYSNENTGLYSDVYFPIIKYSIVCLFNKSQATEQVRYYSSEDIQDFINEKFKIQIPTIVLAQSIKKIDKSQDFVKMEVMEGGEVFQIKRVWDSQEFDEMDKREGEFNKGLKKIEEEYKRFLEENGIYDDGVSYLQFISDNTEEVLGYFQNSDISKVDEKYATLIFFLEYLHDDSDMQEEFRIANQLFWASIIAGYLRSEKPPVDSSEDGSIKEYFLDTPIVMGMMELSTQKTEAYAAELREIIKSSGCSMRIHPLTVEEINKILNSVEGKSRPDPSSPIAEAWERHGLSINKLVDKRLKIESILKELGIMKFPLAMNQGVKEVVNQYREKPNVKKLVARWSRGANLYLQEYSGEILLDNFREIHDMYMDEYIQRRRKEKNESENIVFVTNNRDLIDFTCRELHPGENTMISTQSVVLDLWMHNTKPAEMSRCALTETMARCLEQHNRWVSNKISEVSKFFNEETFDAEIYKEFIKKLYQRAKNVIMAVEDNQDKQDQDKKNQRIFDAIKADNEIRDNRLAEMEHRLSEQEQRTKEVLENKNREHDNVKKELAREKAGRETAEKKVRLLEKKEEIRKEIERKEADIVPLEKNREKYFCDWQPWALIIPGIILIFAAIVTYCFPEFRIPLTFWKAVNWGGLAIGIALITWGININDKGREEKRRQKAYKKWDNKPENKKYCLLICEKKQLEKELNEINSQLDDF